MLGQIQGFDAAALRDKCKWVPDCQRVVGGEKKNTLRAILWWGINVRSSDRLSSLRTQVVNRADDHDMAEGREWG